MKKLIILFILAVLLPAGAYAAGTGNMDGEKVAKLIARNTMRGYHGFVELGMGVTMHNFDGFASDSKSTVLVSMYLLHMVSNSIIFSFSVEVQALQSVRNPML